MKNAGEWNYSIPKEKVDITAMILMKLSGTRIAFGCNSGKS